MWLEPDSTLAAIHKISPLPNEIMARPLSCFMQIKIDLKKIFSVIKNFFTIHIPNGRFRLTLVALNFYEIGHTDTIFDILTSPYGGGTGKRSHPTQGKNSCRTLALSWIGILSVEGIHHQKILWKIVKTVNYRLRFGLKNRNFRKSCPKYGLFRSTPKILQECFFFFRLLEIIRQRLILLYFSRK